MLGKYKGLGKKRFFLIFALCDETFSVVSSVEPPEDVEKGLFYFFITFLCIMDLERISFYYFFVFFTNFIYLT